MQVATILARKGTMVHTVPETGTLAEAVALLRRHRIGALVVTDAGGDIVGILSERDVVYALAAHRRDGALELGIDTAMTRRVLTCTRDTPIAEVMETMTHARVRHMPVAENGELIGIVSIGDVVKRKIEEVEEEATELKRYIAS